MFSNPSARRSGGTSRAASSEISTPVALRIEAAYSETVCLRTALGRLCSPPPWSAGSIASYDQVAPSSIHSRSACFSAADSGGRFCGIASDSAISHTRLSLAAPGTIALPWSPPARADSREERSSPACLTAESWQSRQRLASSGAILSWNSVRLGDTLAGTDSTRLGPARKFRATSSASRSRP